MKIQNSIIYNEISIPCPIKEEHRMIPVKTICDIIDVKFENQDGWLKKHQYYSQLLLQVGVVAADNKVRKMNCLPIFDVLSWLSSISENQRRAGSIQKQYIFMAWLRSKMMEMYKLIEVFQEENKYELQLMETKLQLIEDLAALNNSAKEVKKKIAQVDKSIGDVREKRFTNQTALPFPEK